MLTLCIIVTIITGWGVLYAFVDMWKSYDPKPAAIIVLYGSLVITTVWLLYARIPPC